MQEGKVDGARMQIHWLRGRRGATAARINFNAVCDWERKAITKLDRISQVDGRILSIAVPRSFPNEMQVFEKLVLDGWYTELEHQLDSKWSVIHNEDSAIVAMNEVIVQVYFGFLQTLL